MKLWKAMALITILAFSAFFISGCMPSEEEIEARKLLEIEQLYQTGDREDILTLVNYLDDGTTFANAAKAKLKTLQDAEAIAVMMELVGQEEPRYKLVRILYEMGNDSQKEIMGQFAQLYGNTRYTITVRALIEDALENGSEELQLLAIEQIGSIITLQKADANERDTPISTEIVKIVINALGSNNQTVRQYAAQYVCGFDEEDYAKINDELLTLSSASEETIANMAVDALVERQANGEDILGLLLDEVMNEDNETVKEHYIAILKTMHAGGLLDDGSMYTIGLSHHYNDAALFDMVYDMTVENRLDINIVLTAMITGTEHDYSYGERLFTDLLEEKPEILESFIAFFSDSAYKPDNIMQKTIDTIQIYDPDFSQRLMAQVKDTDDTTANNILDTLLYNAKYDDNPYSYNVFALFGQEVEQTYPDVDERISDCIMSLVYASVVRGDNESLVYKRKAGWAFWQDDKSDGSLDQLLAKFILNSYESTDEKRLRSAVLAMGSFGMRMPILFSCAEELITAETEDAEYAAYIVDFMQRKIGDIYMAAYSHSVSDSFLAIFADPTYEPGDVMKKLLEVIQAEEPDFLQLLIADVKDADDATAYHILDTVLYTAREDGGDLAYNVFNLFAKEVEDTYPDVDDRITDCIMSLVYAGVQLGDVEDLPDKRKAGLMYWKEDKRFVSLEQLFTEFVLQSYESTDERQLQSIANAIGAYSGICLNVEYSLRREVEEVKKSDPEYAAYLIDFGVYNMGNVSMLNYVYEDYFESLVSVVKLDFLQRDANKIVPIIYTSFSYEVCESVFSDLIPMAQKAYRPEEARYVIAIESNRNQIGTYTNGAKGYMTDVTVTIIDKAIGKSLAKRFFSGLIPDYEIQSIYDSDASPGADWESINQFIEESLTYMQ